MRNKSVIRVLFIFGLMVIFTACESKITPCECGKNLMKSNDEIDEELETKCNDYVLSLSHKEQKSWNKKVLDCTSKEEN
jgi:hypothetical protein